MDEIVNRGAFDFGGRLRLFLDRAGLWRLSVDLK